MLRFYDFMAQINKKILGIFQYCRFFLFIIIIVLYPHSTVEAFNLTSGNKIYSIEDAELSAWKGFAKSFARKSLEQPRTPPSQLIKTYFRLTEPYPQPKNESKPAFGYKAEKIYAYLKNISKEINASALEPKFVVKDGRVIDFSPSQTGITLNLYDSTFGIVDALTKNSKSFNLITVDDPPKTMLSDINSLGIKELVASGQSNFSGSPKNRIHNIKIGVEKMKGVLVAPGATFSFNDNLGPVDGEHGFLPELVIKKTGTVPEFGGGLCQVSSTTFRAAMNAGLPITERKNHAYAVQYYSPQGTDATIYPGVVDLKFANDTSAYLLIWPYFKNPNILVFDFYGSKDSRTVTLEKPVQYDKNTDGSMKASWTRIVKNNGIINTSTFKSIYLPPALFHKEEQFVSTATPPLITKPSITN